MKYFHTFCQPLNWYNVMLRAHPDAVGFKHHFNVLKKREKMLLKNLIIQNESMYPRAGTTTFCIHLHINRFSSSSSFTLKTYESKCSENDVISISIYSTCGFEGLLWSALPFLPAGLFLLYHPAKIKYKWSIQPICLFVL